MKDKSTGFVMGEMDMEGEAEGFNWLVSKADTGGGGINGKMRKYATTRRGGIETSGMK
ncbi:MAG: hypothetical protein LBK50_00710 [Candidatus Nomurabacteria bacterium]|jgi:hypothetical protein|nr:hypothetical protein [Candidatus Nomurabacteria bacterium]